VLVSAYACEPGRGSEPEVGLQVVLAAASRHEVWVLTRKNNIDALQGYFASHPLAGRVHLVGVELGAAALAMKRRLGPLGLYPYYAAWQRVAADKAIDLHREVGFDLVHHATFATYWQRAIGPALALPFVWGPVGGGASTPWRLLPELGARGVIRDAARFVIQRIGERLPAVQATMRSASVALAQNPETARRLVGPDSVEVVPNGVSASVESAPGGARTTELLVVGRQIPYKGGVLAVRTLAAVRHPEAHLTFIGGGPERKRIERVARRLGVADRISFPGRMPRDQVIQRMGRAAALLHPALHDDSPLTVCEALSVGTPVVALEVGGPPVLLARWPEVPSVAVRPAGRTETVRRLAEAADGFLSNLAPVPVTVVSPTVSFAESVLAAYRTALTGAR
jgi:glycosyltransferase involved in cell wall biosynthesis